jgi:hypothetical protein
MVDRSMTDFPSSPETEAAIAAAKTALHGVVRYLHFDDDKHQARALSSTDSIVDRLVSYLGHAQCQQQWQPIKTAPKDGLIDIWTVGWGAKPHRVSDCYYDSICGEWRTSRPMGQLHCVKERYVTHWMPRPAGPALADTSTDRPCDGCDGHECDNGCAYPGAVTSPDQPAPFYGAQCPSYPNCIGGCGLGCTHEIELAQRGGK